MADAKKAEHSSRPDDRGEQTESAGSRSKGTPEGGDLFNWHKIQSFVLSLRKYLRLYAAILIAGVVLVITGYAIVEPTYTAVALVGPPGPSPAVAMMGGAGAAPSIAGRLFGGLRSSGADNPYDDFLQLLPSTKLARVLIERDHLLGQTGHKEPNSGGTGDSVGFLQSIKNAIKLFLNRPISSQTGTDEMMKYLSAHLTVGPSTRSLTSGPLSLTSPFMVVTLSGKDRQQAENTLEIILAETDRIIRDERRRDVTARITFLRNELARQTLTSDERQALIAVLSDQEQLQVMLQADQRYSSTLVVPPYASSTPTNPPGLTTAVTRVALISLILWIGIVFLSTRIPLVDEWIVRLRCKIDPSTSNWPKGSLKVGGIFRRGRKQ